MDQYADQDRARYSLDEQIICVRREIRMRERVYPRWVAAQKMSQPKAIEELATMQAVLATLERLRSHGPQPHMEHP